MFPVGAPLPIAPPCIRQRVFPRTGGDLQGVCFRVRAPHRGFIGNGSARGCWGVGGCRLSRLVNDVANPDLRLCFAPMATERGHQAAERASRLRCHVSVVLEFLRTFGLRCQSVASHMEVVGGDELRGQHAFKRIGRSDIPHEPQGYAPHRVKIVVRHPQAVHRLVCQEQIHVRFPRPAQFL